jgi:hypothetical protein
MVESGSCKYAHAAFGARACGMLRGSRLDDADTLPEPIINVTILPETAGGGKKFLYSNSSICENGFASGRCPNATGGPMSQECDGGNALQKMGRKRHAHQSPFVNLPLCRQGR